MFNSFVYDYIVDESDRLYYSELDQGRANQDQISRAFTLVSKLPKSVRNKIFTRRLRDSQLSTRPRELSSNDKLFYSSEQLAHGKRLVQLHGNFSPVYQVLLHAADIATRPEDADCFDLASSYRDFLIVICHL